MMTLNDFFNKCVNYTLFLQSLFSGRPAILKREKFLKITARPATIKHLSREVNNAAEAQKWDFYSDRVLPMRKVTPFIIASRLIDKAGTESQNESIDYKLCSMIDISISNRDHALEAPKKSAQQIIESRLNNLHIDLTEDRPLYSKFKDCLDSGYFTYKIPQTPMHGDFHHINTLVDNKKLWLIDWEYAHANGSILHDWWMLHISIKTRKEFKVKFNPVQKLKIQEFYTFLHTVLDELQLTAKQFNTFNTAMHIVINFTRPKAHRNKNFQKMYDALFKTILHQDSASYLNPEFNLLGDKYINQH